MVELWTSEGLRQWLDEAGWWPVTILTGHARAKLVRKLRYQVIIDSVFHGAQYNYRACVVHWKERCSQVNANGCDTTLAQILGDWHSSHSHIQADTLTFLLADRLIGQNILLLATFKHNRQHIRADNYFKTLLFVCCFFPKTTNISQLSLTINYHFSIISFLCGFYMTDWLNMVSI